MVETPPDDAQAIPRRPLLWAGLAAAILLGQRGMAQDTASVSPELLAMRKASADRALADIGPGGDLDARVGRLIDRLVLDDPAAVQSAVDALVVLGRPAVPAIIRRLDDRRTMKSRHLMYVNESPNAFEGIRHYSTLKVVDALTQVLNAITGDVPIVLPDFALVEPSEIAGIDRSTDPRRAEAVAAWRAYLARSPATPRAPSKSLPG